MKFFTVDVLRKMDEDEGCETAELIFPAYLRHLAELEGKVPAADRFVDRT